MCTPCMHPSGCSFTAIWKGAMSCLQVFLYTVCVYSSVTSLCVCARARVHALFEMSVSIVCHNFCHSGQFNFCCLKCKNLSFFIVLLLEGCVELSHCFPVVHQSHMQWPIHMIDSQEEKNFRFTYIREWGRPIVKHVLKYW